MNTYESFKDKKLELKKKGQFNYAQWAEVWKEVLAVDSDATYHVHESEKGKPVIQINQSCMVKVSITIKDVTKTEWLPVLNNSNKPILVELLNVFDVNTTIKRCLVKCAALFGLGLQVFIDGNNPEDEEAK